MKLELGVTGGIAAYKIPGLIRSLKRNGFDVHCTITDNALRFVTPDTLQIVSENAVTSRHRNGSSTIDHLYPRHNADCFIVAPATANFIAKAAIGICDTPLLSAFLAYPGHKLIAPAMHDTMWTNPATQHNVQTLKNWGVEFIGPDHGALACGDYGPGRMIDPELILLKLQLIQSKCCRLDGTKILVVLGGTSEAIDPVRVITNRSTGKLGSTLAHSFGLQGAQVSAISTIPLQYNPHISEVHYVESASEMERAVHRLWDHHDILVMPAAVSDFRPDNVSVQKVKRSADMIIKLRPTTDIIASLPKRSDQKIIGFCLENSDQLLESAKTKLKNKNLDAIIANTSDQFGKDMRTFSLITEDSMTTFDTVSLIKTSTTICDLIKRLSCPN